MYVLVLMEDLSPSELNFLNASFPFNTRLFLKNQYIYMYIYLLIFSRNSYMYFNPAPNKNMDDKVEPKPRTTKMKLKSTNQKLSIPDVDLEDFNKHSHLLVSSPTSQSLTKSPSAKLNCLCSPTTHAGSFRCRHHRVSGMHRAASVGSNLSDFARKSGSICDSLQAQ